MNTELQKADFGKRLAAFLIDHVVLCIIGAIGAPFLLWDVHINGFDRLWIVFPIFMFIIFFIYCFKDVIGGASIGKRIIGLVVICNDATTAPPKKRLFLRNVFSFLWPLELLMMLCSKRKSKIGDMLAGTDVYMAK